MKKIKISQRTLVLIAMTISFSQRNAPESHFKTNGLKISDGASLIKLKYDLEIEGLPN